MTPQDIAYLRQKAQAAGYNADDLLKVMNYESSGRPGIWGGKGGQYFGLIQFGPNERKQFGVDTANPSAQNQIDATMKFLAARGFKPGMGLLDLYSTVNAGSPGHYKASDGNGTVASHVAAMSGQAPLAANGVSEEPMPAPLSYAAADQEQPYSIEDILKEKPKAEKTIPYGLLGLRQAMADEEQKNTEYDDEMKRQMKALHDQVHQASLAGLLGGGM